eukprot:1160892-Pelagomonas_calceolata.AAC.5
MPHCAACCTDVPGLREGEWTPVSPSDATLISDRKGVIEVACQEQIYTPCSHDWWPETRPHVLQKM